MKTLSNAIISISRTSDEWSRERGALPYMQGQNECKVASWFPSREPDDWDDLKFQCYQRSPPVKHTYTLIRIQNLIIITRSEKIFTASQLSISMWYSTSPAMSDGFQSIAGLSGKCVKLVKRTNLKFSHFILGWYQRLYDINTHLSKNTFSLGIPSVSQLSKSSYFLTFCSPPETKWKFQ